MIDRSAAMLNQIPATPYDWPFDGQWCVSDTALLLLGFQNGTIAEMSAQYTLGVALELLEVAKNLEMTVVASRRVFRPDANAINSRWKALGTGTFPIGSGESSLAQSIQLPERSILVDHAGDNAFFDTELEDVLRTRGVRNLLITGLPTDGLVHSTQRAANDMGFECLTISDACQGTSEFRHEGQLRITTFGNGLFGAVATADQVRAALTTN